MEVLHVDNGKINPNINCEGKFVYTIGNFDGLHQGHMRVINELVKNASQTGEKSGVVTFAAHPFSKKEDFRVLSCNSEKLECFKEAGVDRVVFFEFEQIRDINYKNFINELKTKFSLSCLILGEGSRLGKSKDGNMANLSQIVKLITVNHSVKSGEKISSTTIRDYVQAGLIEKANELLGRNYEISGKRVQGEKIAESLGFPTVNIAACQVNKIIPAKGVYAAKLLYCGKEYLAACNIGVKPTFSSFIKQAVVEVHAIDVDNLKIKTDEDVKVSFIERIRDEIKFENKNDLIEQIKTDIKNIKETYGGIRNESYQRRERADYKRVCC